MGETTYTVVRQGIAGAVGGFVAFVLLEPGSLATEASRMHHALGDVEILTQLRDMALFGGAIGACIAGALTLGDELGSGRPARIAGRAALALLVGPLIGGVAGLVAQILFRILLEFGALLIARTLGWALFGAGVGLAGGAITGSSRRALQGLAGGAVGGVVGGVLFDILGVMTHGGTASRLIGMVATGICVGVAVALVQEIAKRAWVTVLTGRREGAQYILNRPQLTIGRAELADIPLFGDASLDRSQAVIAATQGAYQVQEVGRPGLLTVDGRAASSAWLRDGSILELGRHRLRFHLRGVVPTATDPMQPSPLLAGYGQAAVWRETAPSPLSPPSVARHEAPFGASVVGSGRPAICLRAVEGPCAGAAFAVPESGGRIGRAPENEICLVADGLASRQHAEIFAEDEGWVIRDLESRNGTVVNGEAVPEAWINPGDEIRIGAGVYRVEEC